MGKSEIPTISGSSPGRAPRHSRRDEEKEVLYAIRALEILVGSGVGLEEAMKHIADADYGCISTEFHRVLDESRKGTYLERSLRDAGKRASSPAFRKMLETLAMGVRDDIEISKILKKTADREFEERRSKLEAFTKKLTGTAEIFMTMGILVPIILIVFGFLGSITKSIAKEAPFMNLDFLANIGMCTIPALAVVVIILITLIFTTRSRDPNL